MSCIAAKPNRVARRIASPTMILERSMTPQWLSNTYLVGDEPGGHAVLIDAGGPLEPLLRTLDAQRLTLDAVLLTHHHHDHVAELDAVLAARPNTAVLIHELERDLVPGVTGTIEPGETTNYGALQ